MLKKQFVFPDPRPGLWQACLLLMLSSLTLEGFSQNRRQVIFDAYGGIGRYVNCPGKLFSASPNISFGAKLQIRDQLSSRFFMVYGVGFDEISATFTCESPITSSHRSSSLLYASFPIGIDYLLRESLFISFEPAPSFILKNRIRFANPGNPHVREVTDSRLNVFFLPFRVSVRRVISDRIDAILASLFSISEPSVWQISAGLRYSLSEGYRTLRAAR